MINYLRNCFLLLFAAAIAAQAAPQVSYFIPDIGAPDLNTYMEIIGPASVELNFGADGFYMNNPGDNVRVRCQNPADSSKVTFGPVVVSWNGKMISTQVYVHPYLKPNSSDWSLLDNQFKIAVVVEVGGQVSNVNTFYIVKPYSLGTNGDISGLAERAFGQGNLGKRSPRGAMIVDSLVLANDDKYNISINDCDPFTSGNQAFLPFVLISKGKIVGGLNTKIQAKGAVASPPNTDAGPGGGGGAGKWCDISGGGTRGGHGFTGGGPGGQNASGVSTNDRQSPGDGTGNASTQVDSKGKVTEGVYSLNGVPGGNSTIAYEASGGGTGHPFGLSGNGCVDGNNCDPEGGYGAGSGRRQDQNGGGGGYATVGGNTSNNNWGRTVGNVMVIPLAGGSGGASGNPQASFSGCSGEGGAGGGAVMVSAMNITNMIVESNGAGGGGSSDGNGGGGSGGFAGIQAKLAVSNVKLTALGGNRGGGEGRMRYDFMSANNNITDPASPASLYKGISTDTTKWVDKNFDLLGGYSSGKTVRLFIKPEHGNWQELPEPIYQSGPMTWLSNITLPNNDTLFFIAAMQSVPNPRQNPVSDKYYMEPSFVMSQAAGNILRKNPQPIIAEDDTTIKVKVYSCEGANDSDTAWVLNKGNAVLKLTYDNNSFTGGNRGFSLVAPLLKDVKINDSIPVVVKFTYIKGQTGIIRDMLVIQHNDLESKRIPWRIFLEAEIIDIKIDALTGNGTDTLDFGEICINSVDTLRYKAVNLSMDKVNFKEPEVVQNTDKFKSWSTSNKSANPGDTVYYAVEFKAQEGTFGSWVYIRIDECADVYDSVYVMGTGVRTDLQISGITKDTIDFGDICIGDKKTFEFNIKNNSIVPVNIQVSTETGQSTVFMNLGSSNPIADGASVLVQVEAIPQAEGPFLVKGFISTNDCGGFKDTIYVKGRGVSGKLVFDPPSIDFGEVKVGNTDSRTAILKNTGTSSVYIQQLLDPGLPFRIASAVPQPPVLLKPGESILVTIEYIPNNDNEHRDTLFADGIAISGACPADTLLPLRGKGIKSLIELDSFQMSFGLIKNCHTKADSVTIMNKGTAATDITSHQIIGVDKQYFRFIQSPNLPFTLNPNGKFTYVVEFVPGNSPDGPKTADLEITTADNSKYVVSLNGENEGLDVTIPPNVNFNAGPIGPDQTKIITAVNNGRFDAHVVKVISSNPKVTVTPQDATIQANGGTTDFTVTMKMDVAGPINADLQFIFDSHCADTIKSKVTGMVLDGNLDYTSNLDYGVLAPCRDSVLTLSINNTGQVPIELRTMQITGKDAGLFSFVTPFAPSTLDVGETYTIDILFDPANTTDGIKTAIVEFTAFYNNKETIYKTNLTGERQSGMISVPEPVDFGNVIIGKNSTKSMRITNTGKQAIQITGIQYKRPDVYDISPANPVVNLATNEFTDLVITFNALAEGCVDDTVIINFSFAGCTDSKPVAMHGCGINAGNITLILPDFKDVDPFIDRFRIPISAVLSQDYKDSILIVNSTTIEISFNANTFLPIELTRGSMTTQQPVAGVRNITAIITAPLIVSKTKTVITELIGSTLLGNTDRTDLTFGNVSLLDASGAQSANVTTQNGSILFKICRNGGDRLLTPSYPLAIRIVPNPASDAVSISVTALEKGAHSVELIDLQGGKHLIQNWYADNTTGNEYKFEFDISGLASGIYYLRVNSPTSSEVEPVFIVK